MIRKKVVAFLSNKLTLRGTEIAIYDYAHYNETLLGNKSIIITRNYEAIKHEFDVDVQAYNKFKQRFDLFYYDGQPDIDRIVLNNEVTHLVVIKSGHQDELYSTLCVNVVLCVFDTSHPHGDVYTPIGQTLNDIYRTNYPVTPHMITMPSCDEDLRRELQIPDAAIVFGRYGGKESFDIGFAHSAIKNVLETSGRDDIYFIFMNTYPFYRHKNITYLQGTADAVQKRKFINTCDALLHARARGETFGLTCGEFSVCKKPVITWNGSVEREHLLILKDKAVTYGTQEDLETILNTFTRDKYDVSENGYMFYTPENVMRIFEKNCLI
jgi:hypothetical protein